MKHQLARAQRGFTLIELMIVVAIIGILAAIAIPQYQDYITRARWADNYAAVGQLKSALAECFQNRNGNTGDADCQTVPALVAAGFLPNNATAASMFPLKPGFGTGALGANGVITFTGGAQTAGAGCIVTLTPTLAAGESTVRWVFANTAPAVCNRTKTGVG
jgi:type IV pilus assembly protein PilA